MSPEICILFTLTDGHALYRCAVKIDANALPSGAETVQYFREPENELALTSLLPEHVRSVGKIVDVEEIFEIVILKHNQ